MLFYEVQTERFYVSNSVHASSQDDEDEDDANDVDVNVNG